MFDWLLYTNGRLIEKYLNKTKYNDKYLINNNLFLVFNKKEKYLQKTNDDYKIKLDFLNKTSNIELIKEGLIFTNELYEVEIEEKLNKKKIIYRIDNDINKIIINERDENNV